MMDECHFLDPMSIAARGVMDYLNLPSNAGINVVYLSATPPGQAPSVGSNYTIREYAAPSTRKLSSEWFESIVRQHGAGKTIAFVPSQDQSERFADSSAGAVSLHRDNFEENYAKALDPETTIIYSTEISEMGANYNVDLVIDLRTAVKPVIQSEDEVILRKQPITTSSMVQRRGRTGRNAPGTYVYPVDAATKEDPYDWVCWLEAQMVLDQLSRMWRTEAHASQPSGAVFRGLGVEVRKGYLEDHIVNFLGLMLCLRVISNARPRQRPLVYWVLSWLAFAVFGLPSVFSCIGFGSWLVLLHASTSSIRLSQMMIPLRMLLHVGHCSMFFLGYLLEHKLRAIGIGLNPILSNILSICTIGIAWTLSRQLNLFSWYLEIVNVVVVLGMGPRLFQILPKVTVAYCATTGLSVTAVMGIGYALILIMKKYNAIFNASGCSGTGLRSYRGNSMIALLISMSLFAIWASEKANIQVAAAVMSVALNVTVLVSLVQTNKKRCCKLYPNLDTNSRNV